MNELMKALEHEGSTLCMMARGEIVRLVLELDKEIALKNAALDAIVRMVDGKDERTLFAGHALTGLIASGRVNVPNCCRDAWAIADAMVDARK
jgi:hypothetical protein